MKTSDELTLQKLLERAAELKATDLHLTAGSPPVLRVDEKLVPMNEFPFLTKEFLNGMLEVFLDDQLRKQFDTDREIAVAYPFHKTARFRVNIFYQRGSVAVSLRYIGGRIPTMKELGFSDAIQKLVDLPRGLIVVTGPFGSGRTTTIASMLEEINKRRETYIMTIEQPIEYLLVNQRSIIEQREVGRDTPSISRALRSVAQEDVNVVAVSDMQDPQVVQAALTLASSGRLVLGAMDTDTVIKTIEYILGTFSSAEQGHARGVLAESLQAIICQRLVPRIGGGKILVAEILTGTSAIKSTIREGNMSRLTTIMQTSRDEGMASLDSTLSALLSTGEISMDTALQYAQDPQALSMRARPQSE